MQLSPLLGLHIASGTVGCLSGGFAAFFRKGSRRHALSGNIFVISMLTLAASGTLLAIVKDQPGNIIGGALTFYLVATAWMTARRRTGPPGLFDWIALILGAGVAAVDLTFGIEAVRKGTSHGYSAGPTPCSELSPYSPVAGDVRMLLRHGISGAARVSRHLWRMCFAFFIAAASIFLARQQLFPAFLRSTGILYLLSFGPLILLAFWMVRVRFVRSFAVR
jgi:hypothetical protein